MNGRAETQPHLKPIAHWGSPSGPTTNEALRWTHRAAPPVPRQRTSSSRGLPLPLYRLREHTQITVDVARVREIAKVPLTRLLAVE